MLYLTYVSYIVIAGLWKNIMCPATIRSENMLSKHKETCYKPSHRTTNKHGETRYRLNCHEERCNRKRIHTHFLKDRICEMQEWQNYFGLYARDAQVKQYLQQQNLGELITAEDKVLIETCESWNNHRYAIVGNKTSQGRHGIISWNLALICEVDHGIIEKSKSTLHRSKKDLRLLNSGTLNRGRHLCVTVAIDHSTVDGFHDELQLSAKKTEGKALRRISWVKGFYSVRWNDYHSISIEIPPIREHSITGITPRVRLVRGMRSLERNFYVTDLEQWIKIDASEFHNEKLTRRRWSRPNWW